jgi:cytochrome c-type biogenesis protein CcmH
MTRRLAAPLLALAICLAPLLTPISAIAAARPRASLTDIENDVMCPSCRESLAVAESPQSYAERNFIRQLIAQGLDKQQIEQALVAQYGPAVLAKPPASGFDLTVYLIPAAIVLLGLGTLAVVLPRWRRSARARLATPLALGPQLSAADARRLEEDLGRFDAGYHRRARWRRPAPGYIDSGAETPRSPSVSAITRWVAPERAIRKDSSSVGVEPTTRHCS